MKLIVIYGIVDSSSCPKQQRMIDGGCTCGYREYAKYAGLIIYPRPQRVSLPWEASMPNGCGIAAICQQYPEAVVWSVKPDHNKDRILQSIANFKIYYSCNCHNTYSEVCDKSLVDIDSRKQNNKCVLHLKGKDPEFWKPVAQSKEFDYLIMGRRADKNEFYFLEQLERVTERRSVLWIGGIKHKRSVKTKHKIEFTDMLGPEGVRDNISRAKVGILYSEHKSEGFPQSFLEMTMCGVPVVYGGPFNPSYFFPENSSRPKKKHLIQAAEELLRTFDADACRKRAIDSYSIQKSVNYLLSLKDKA